MRALCVRQPWASMIAEGRKRIETRTWATAYRGELMIVASRSPKIDGLPGGVALCVARLTDCRRMTRRDAAAACCELYPGAYAWVLEEVRPIRPVPVRGQLGLFAVPGHLRIDYLAARAHR